MQSGTILLKSATGHHEKVLAPLPRARDRVRGVGQRAELRRRMPIYDIGAFWPPKRPE